MARSARKDTHDSRPRNLGRYRLYGELAAGGMATVHFGRQVGSGGFSKVVAIKRLHAQFGKIEEFVDMFLAEARLAARIKHPSVVQPLDVLRVEDEVFLVMEYVEGDSLSRLMKATIARQEKVPLPVAVTIMSGVLRGLHAAHEAKSDKGEPLGIVHRDVSPQNVLVGIDGTARVIDFGIAKAADSVQVTREGELKGKLAYIAPEILSGHRGTRRSDTYAAAVVLWEVLTAQRLFDADYQSAILANILHRPIDLPSDFISGISPALDEVVMKGLARDPSDRYPTAREMAIALEESTPMASAATVGEWVELVAATSLGNRARRVSEIEARSSEEDSEEPPEEVLSEFMVLPPADPWAAPHPQEPPSNPPPSGPARSGHPSSRRPAPAASDQEFRAVRSSLPPPAPPARPRLPTLPPAPADLGASFVPLPPPPPARSLPPPTISVEAGDALPAWPVPGIAPSEAGATVVLGPKRRSSGGGLAVLILLLALASAVIYLGLPEFMRRNYIAVAAREGVTLTIDSTQIGWQRVRFVGVTATMADLPGFSLHAHSLEVFFSGRLDPTEASASDVLLSIDGTGSTVADSLRRLQLAHDFKDFREGTLRQVAVEGGHLVWSRAFGEGTRLEAENVALDVERNGHEPLGDDLTATSPLVWVTATWGKAGPWILNAQVDHGQTKATVTLDPSGTSKGTLTFGLDGTSLTSFDLSLPRSNVGLLGIGSIVARRAEDPLFATGEAHFIARSPSRVEASLKLDLSGARLANAPAATDASLEVHAEGDPTRPIDVTRGTFGYGPFRGTLSGPVTLGGPFLRADLGFRTNPAACPGGGATSLGGGFVFDTRNLADARLLVAPSGHCGLKILPP